MSSAKQQLVQSLLRDRDRALGLDGGAGAGSGAFGSGADEGALSHVVDELSAMGFSPQHVQLAYERTSVRTAGGVSVESLLDWLLINLPAEQLPGQFTKGEGSQRSSCFSYCMRFEPLRDPLSRRTASKAKPDPTYTSRPCLATLPSPSPLPADFGPCIRSLYQCTVPVPRPFAPPPHRRLQHQRGEPGGARRSLRALPAGSGPAHGARLHQRRVRGGAAGGQERRAGGAAAAVRQPDGWVYGTDPPDIACCGAQM